LRTAVYNLVISKAADITVIACQPNE